jgi:murein DD-endopeptidase MepM/ murein hydrolase activator NlpD
VVLAEDQFYSGNAVYIDHGGGLISMYFDLSEIRMMAGQEVKKGDTVGLVGTTGCSNRGAPVLRRSMAQCSHQSPVPPREPG